MRAALNISLPESMKEFVEAEVARGGYSTPSEYVRELIREAQRRKAGKRENRLLDALLAGERIAGDPVLEAVHQRLRKRIDDKLLAALESGRALDGEEVMARLRKRNAARPRKAK